MNHFFDAKKIAVIGASRDPMKVGHVVFKNLRKNLNLTIFPINPNTSHIEGVKTYVDVLEIPYSVDMAVIAIKHELVPEALEKCGKKGIKNVILISAGFAESGDIELNNKIRDIISYFKINLLGPNVLGIIDPYKNLNASFFKDMPAKGNIGFISQSGAVGTAVLDRINEEHLGISGFVSIGNQMQIDLISALEYFAVEKYTDIICFYVESLKQGTGKQFVDVCKRISAKKRIIALKAGKTAKGELAAKTHTASLSSPAEIYSGAFKQAGIIEVESLNEMFQLMEILTKFKSLGKRAVIITNAGGLGVLTADACEKSGIELPEIPERVLIEFDSFLARGYGRNNPLDILGDALSERYDRVIKILGRESFFDFFIVLLSPQEMTQPLDTARVMCSSRKPVVSCFIGGKSFEIAKKFVKEQKIVNFNDVSDLSVLGKIVN